MPMNNPLAGLLQQGLALLEQLALATKPQNGSKPQNGRSPSPFETAKDERTGQTYLKLPLPDPNVINQTYAAIHTLLDSFRK